MVQSLTKKCKHPLFPVLVFSAALFSVGLNWGLPNTVSWMADALAPWDPLVGLSQAFSFGYFNKYPLVHQLILAVLYIPVVLYSVFSHADPSGFQLHQFMLYARSQEFATILIYIGRLVSVLMGLGIVYYLYRAAAEMFNERAGIWAAVLVSFNTVLNFYAHNTKVEVPHVFWAVISLYYLIRVVKYNTTRDHVLTALFACLSFGTKDQAYAVFVLPFIVYVFLHPVINRKKGQTVFSVITSKNILIFVAVFVVGTLIVENIFLNWEGFLYRLRHLTGEGGTRSISYTLGPAGIYALWRDIFREIMIDATGVPVFLLSLVGIAVIFLSPEERKKGLMLRSLFLVAMLSFMIFFVQVIRQSSVRFAFIQSILITAYGGCAVDFLLSKVSGRTAVKYALFVSLAFAGVYSLYNTVSVNVNMLGDPRYEAEEWMRKNLPKGSMVEYFSAEHFVPRFPKGVETRRIKNGYLDIEDRKPDYLVLNNKMIAANQGYLGAESTDGRIMSAKNQRSIKSGEPYFVKMLLNNELRYREVFRSYSKRYFFRRHRVVNISADYIVIFKRTEGGSEHFR